MLCTKCVKREASITVGGRKLCELCANNEVTRRAYRVLLDSGAIDLKHVTVLSSPQFSGAERVLSRLFARMGRRHSRELEVVELAAKGGSVDTLIHSFLTAKGDLVLLPFTSDFLTAYLIYSISKGRGPIYVKLYSPYFHLRGTLFVSPMIRTSILELKGMGRVEIRTGEEEFDELHRWVLDQLAENPELLFTAPSSAKLFEGAETCQTCGATLVGGICPMCAL
ncbi:hypothetical protein [Sulfodiicoccus acidiphilus]|uniref:hypothetical protein n=1 Tax=Sulfodiicoccus acidiphilus TaxID=1670455 RepID=UPI000F82F1A3|nr:hypothetical protein [Sulfodiicoccus acidiphilus]